MSKHVRWAGASLAVAGLAAVVTSGGGVGAGAANAGRAPIRPLPIVHAAYQVGKSLDPDEVITMSVRLADSPVAQVAGEAEEAGAPISEARKAELKGAISAAQRPLRAQLAQMGATVRYELQTTANAIVVAAPRRMVAAIRALPGVKSVVPSSKVERSNTASNAFTGAAQAWQSTGLTGKGIKIAIVDDGVDYTHATFGGPGTAAAYDANNRAVIEKGTFPTKKVVGGYDFVGDDYNAASADPALLIPVPDPDPLACGIHGTHVAGTAAGKGVKADGSAFNGPYTPAAVAGLRIGPGSAPEASIYAYKVFGCDGSVDDAVIAAALERAVVDGIDVVNMSLGSPWGGSNSIAEEAVNNAVNAGITVLISAGNDGPSAYMVGGASTADRAISVAAVDASTPTYGGAAIGDTGVIGVNANAAALPVTGTVRVLRNADGTIARGCAQEEYAAVQAGEIIVTVRGTCARTDRAEFGQAAGAAGVIMINNAAGLPPFEGTIRGVTIPFVGVDANDSDTVTALDGQSLTVNSGGTIPNATYASAAPFSSAGPRSGDAAPKPDLSAPGVSVISAESRTGNLETTLSGTSMAAPHAAGVAALTVQAHPSWNQSSIKAALMNTADPGALVDYDPRREGTGLIQPQKAIATQVVVTTTRGRGTVAFGYEQLRKTHFEDHSIAVRNHGVLPVTYNLSAETTGDSLGTIVAVTPSSVTVPAGGSVEVKVSLTIPLAAAAALPPADASILGGLVSARGAIVATPANPTPANPVLRVPWGVVPRGLSSITATPALKSVSLANKGIHAGNADFYAWQLAGTVGGAAIADLRAAGIQQFPGDALGGDPADTAVVFAVNTFGRWSNAGQAEIDIFVNNDADPEPDVIVAMIDNGILTTGDTPDGIAVAVAVDLATGNILSLFPASAPQGGSTVLLPTFASVIGKKFTYSVSSADLLTGENDTMPGVAKWNVAAPPVSNGDFVTLAPGATAKVPLTRNANRLTRTPVLGWMVVTADDANGSAQADLVKLADVPK